VHRDLKPENIYLCVSKRRDVAFTAKILDFGIAKLVEDGMKKTGTQPLGSPLFMAPEQTDRKGKISPATDVWALGLITFYLLTGKSFWLGADGDSLPQLLREVVVDPIPPATERATELGVVDKLPEGFDAWFARCLDRDVDARWKNAGEATRAFAEIVPTTAKERKLEVRTGTVDAAMSSMKDELTSAPTQLVSDADVPRAPAARDTTGSASVSVASPEVIATVKSEPSSPSRTMIPVLAIALIAGGAGAYFALRGGKTTAGATAAAKSAGTAATAASSTSAAFSASASASAAAGSTGPVAPDDPRCPKGMVFHPAGTTIIGAKDMPDSSADSRVTHSVTLSAFCLDLTEVTVAAYEECVATGKCEKTPNDVSYEGVTEESKKAYTPFCNARKPDRKNHPINCVDWNMADAFCTWKGARLPTEAEWEFAARGSQQRDFPWGDGAPDETHLDAAGSEYVKWAEGASMKASTMFAGDDGFVGTAPVGSFPKGASQYGVLDLAGNVWEWTADWYAPYSPAAATDPKGPPAGTHKVVRGGSFNGSMIDWAKPAYRWKSLPATYNHGIGFRCASAAKSAG
jgi:formylglycine-generating enzyme required for sulfatase activity